MYINPRAYGMVRLKHVYHSPAARSSGLLSRVQNYFKLNLTYAEVDFRLVYSSARGSLRTQSLITWHSQGVCKISPRNGEVSHVVLSMKSSASNITMLRELWLKLQVSSSSAGKEGFEYLKNNAPSMAAKTRC
jgi:hypothetical protein